MALTKVQGEGISGVSISANNEMTMSSQPAFQARLASNQTNIATGSQVTILYATEQFDANADYNNSNYTFTAPVTGKYQLSVQVLITTLDSAAAYYQIQLHTSNAIYYHTIDPDFGQDALFWTLTLSLLVDMDANDTATVHIFQEGSGTGSQTDINNDSFFSGYLVC